MKSFKQRFFPSLSLVTLASCAFGYISEAKKRENFSEAVEIESEFNLLERITSPEYKTAAIFSGHIPKFISSDYPGPLSATGKREYLYNDAISTFFLNKSDSPSIFNPFQKSFLEYKVVFSGQEVPFGRRLSRARLMGADLLVEIHHDSGHQREIDLAKQQGPKSNLWNRLSGFSLHILPGTDSIPAIYYEESKQLAELIGEKFLELGYKPNQFIGYELIDSEKGIYHRSRLRILKDAGPVMPAVLVEIGNISNPAEEQTLSQHENRKEIAQAIDSAIRTYFNNTSKK